MAYLVAYDIADPRRLRRVARFMERRALRPQKSVFWYEGDAADVAALLADVLPLLDVAEDVVQAWRLTDGQSPRGLAQGSPLSLHPVSVVLEPSRTRLIDPESR